MKSMHSHSYVHTCINFVYKVCMTINISYVCIASDNYIIGYIKLYASTIFLYFRLNVIHVMHGHILNVPVSKMTLLTSFLTV